MYELEHTTDELPAGTYYIKVTNGLSGAEHYGYEFSVNASNKAAIIDEEKWEDAENPYNIIAPFLGEYDKLNGDWFVSTRLDSGRILYAGMKYTRTVEYDGRKHVVKDTKKASASINPDIESSGVIVVLGGERLGGITTSGFKYKDNEKPATTGYYSKFDEIDGFEAKTAMQIIPTVKYDSKDFTLKKILKEERDFKKKLSALLAPKLLKQNTSPSQGAPWNWNTYSSTPILVDIQPLDVGDTPEIHTTAELNNNPVLKNSGGFFVYNGKTNVNFKVIELGGEKHICPATGTAGSFSYQVAYTLDDGQVKTRQLKLRAGKWDNKIGNGEDGEKIIVPVNNGAFDYIVSREMAPGQDLALDIFDEDFNDDLYVTAHRGYFKGTFDSIERAESVKQKEYDKYYLK